MKLNKLVLALGMGVAMISGAANAAAAADQGHGSVKFTGSIIDAPCSVNSTPNETPIDLGEISSAALADNGTSTPKVFEIELDNCDVATAKDASVTFTGAADPVEKNHLAISGTASGASIVLIDGDGSAITLGTASSPQLLQDGTNHLEFSAYLQGDGASTVVTPGDFSSVADFTLAYK